MNYVRLWRTVSGEKRSFEFPEGVVGVMTSLPYMTEVEAVLARDLCEVST